MNTLELLEKLISFDTVSSNSNRDLIDFCQELLAEIGADCTLIEDESGAKANLYATIGPRDRPGVLLSGHSDVVPVEGQNWQVPAFQMTRKGDKLYGRGTTDMKGFLASALRTAVLASRRPLATPLHLAISYDEEIGCVGVHSLLSMLNEAPFRPLFCIVGEPTEMQIATGHKGKTAFHTHCQGFEAHSALAPTALNAIHLACDMIQFIRTLQDKIIANGVKDDVYDIPFSTLHIGRINGGGALNIVPNSAGFAFEIRNLPEDDPSTLICQIEEHATALLAPLKPKFPMADITITKTTSYPALHTDEGAEVVQFVKSLTGANTTIKVAFGTEGGLFSSKLTIPTVICGPGSMKQGHKPDEFIRLSELEKCDAMLDALLDRLEIGL